MRRTLHAEFITPPTIEKQRIVMSVYVCLSVCMCVCVCVSVCGCLFDRDHTFGTAHPIFTKVFVHVTYGRGSVLLWRRTDTLCTSGFVDDVMFAYKPRLLEVAAQLKRGSHAALGLAINCAQ